MAMPEVVTLSAFREMPKEGQGRALLHSIRSVGQVTHRSDEREDGRIGTDGATPIASN